MIRNGLRLVSIVTQLSLVASGLLVTFGYPLVFGFDAYGAFASACALTFVVHRIVDLTLESMIANRSIYDIIIVSVSIFFFILALTILTSYFVTLDESMINYELFFSLVYSTTVLNIIFKIGNIYKQAFFATMFLLITSIIFAFAYFENHSDIALLIATTNFTGATVGLLVAFPHIADDYRSAEKRNFGAMCESLTANISELPHRIGFASFNIFLGFGVVLAVGSQYESTQVGALRMFTALILLGFSLTPLNPKSYYLLADGVEKPLDLIHKLRSQIPSLILAVAGWAVMVCSVKLPIWPTTLQAAKLALATYPAILLVSALDKILLTTVGLKRAGIFIFVYMNLCLFGVLAGNDFEQVKQIIVSFVIAYPVVLTAVFCRPFLPIALTSSVVASCAAAVLSLDAEVGIAGWIAMFIIVSAMVAISHWKLKL